MSAGPGPGPGTDPDWRPPHAYVPGRTPRHPDGLFDPIRADPDLAWAAGLAYLRDGFFWEAHEVLEAVWLGQPPDAPARALTEGMIQLANAAQKRRMGRPRAEARLRAIAAALLDDALERSGGELAGFDRAAVDALVVRVLPPEDAV